MQLSSFDSDSELFTQSPTQPRAIPTIQTQPDNATPPPASAKEHRGLEEQENETNPEMDYTPGEIVYLRFIPVKRWLITFVECRGDRS